jgi:hypothetical protein
MPNNSILVFTEKRPKFDQNLRDFENFIKTRSSIEPKQLIFKYHDNVASIYFLNIFNEFSC